MKKLILSIVLTTSLAFYSCKKESSPEPEPVSPVNTDNYLSLADFYLKNEVKLQTFTVNALTGGTYISPQTTTVFIAPSTTANASDYIQVGFKDIYTKSDMLLSDMTTQLYQGKPLESAGEFYINLEYKSNTTTSAPLTTLSVSQPAFKPIDKDMTTFTRYSDTIKAWVPSSGPNYSLYLSTSSYVSQILSYSNGPNPGAWFNTDRPIISNSAETAINFKPKAPISATAHAYLVFKKENCTVHIYPNSSGIFYYNYASIGLECTFVSFSIVDGKLYSSILPLKIEANQTINFDLKLTTTDEFKTALKALN